MKTEIEAEKLKNYGRGGNHLRRLVVLYESWENVARHLFLLKNEEADSRAMIFFRCANDLREALDVPLPTPSHTQGSAQESTSQKA